ncbi:DUF255 domain-containing protein [Clostridiisalibacter paucivorans]|uniref:DUF255 domain-containing protein n=1 Tax=Clostridiisalibacter paucivorans TaxID=408753 RepID=UPI00047E2994|nr:DUF255 domain-containing protein [Clostridiisalibacter paucivorans]
MLWEQIIDNPMDWYSWSDEAFQKAKLEDKPIFLSIGYSTCHWCFCNLRYKKIMIDVYLN